MPRHTWPKVATRELTPDERAEALAIGTASLDAVLATEERKIKALHGLRALAEASRSNLDILDNPAAAQTWAEGIAVLGKYYDDGCNDCTGHPICELNEAALYAERQLSASAGECLYISGGDSTTVGVWFRDRRENVEKQIAMHGLASRRAGARRRTRRLGRERGSV